MLVSIASNSLVACPRQKQAFACRFPPLCLRVLDLTRPSDDKLSYRPVVHPSGFAYVRIPPVISTASQTTILLHANTSSPLADRLAKLSFLRALPSVTPAQVSFTRFRSIRDHGLSSCLIFLRAHSQATSV